MKKKKIVQKFFLFILCFAMFASATAAASEVFKQTAAPISNDIITKTTEKELYDDMDFHLSKTDPDFVTIMNDFLYGDIYNQSDKLTPKEKDLISVVSLVAQQSDELLKYHVTKVLNATLTPTEIKEAVYQCAPYIGFPRVIDAIQIVNDVFTENNIALPLESQRTTTEETRFDAGLDAQTTIFGEGMRKIASGGKEAMPLSSYYLVTNCFGDFYTRDGLDLAAREMLTLAILCNLGTEPQIKSHITGNLNMGRDKETIAEVMYQCLPYMGYPRFLNAAGYLEEVMQSE